MGAKIPRWEEALWSYLGHGDGNRCPLYEHCRVRKKCGWCISDHIADMAQLLEDGKLNGARHDFTGAEPKKLGRPFQLVERLAYKYLRKGKVHGPPTPIELISLLDAERAVEISTIPLKAHHGAIWCLKDRWIIQLRSRDPPAMRRHTLFHEAFHVLAHRSGSPVFRKMGIEVGYFNEWLADYFAICILMPREWVKEKWVEVKDVNRMAESFNVPKLAMWMRLRQLGLV